MTIEEGAPIGSASHVSQQHLPLGQGGLTIESGIKSYARIATHLLAELRISGENLNGLSQPLSVIAPNSHSKLIPRQKATDFPV